MEEKVNEITEQKNSAVTIIEKTEIKQEEVQTEMIEKSQEEQKNHEQNKKKKLRIILIISAILITIIAILSTIFAVINISNDKIINGIQINAIDVSKMTKEEAKIKLEEIYSKKAENEIYLKHEEFETTTTYQALEVKYKIEQAIEQAHQIGRNGNLLKDNFDIIKSLAKGIQIDLEVRVDEEMLNQVAQNITNSIEGADVQPDYYQEGEKLIITSGKEGLKVEEEKLYQEIYQVVKNEGEAQKIIIPMMSAVPDEINV